MIQGRAYVSTLGNQLCSVCRKISAVFLSLPIVAALPACASLDMGVYEEQGTFVDSEVTLTLVDEIAGTTMLRVRGTGVGGAAGQTYSLGFAAAVAARGNDVFVVDRSAGHLVRINLALGEARILTTLLDPDTHGIYAAPDLTLYVVDKANRAVRRLNSAGDTLRVYTDLSLMPAPVDVAETGAGNVIVVADSLNQQLILFNPLAGAFEVMGSNASRSFFAQAVHAIAATRNSVYLLDTGMGEVTRFGLRGNPLANYGEDELQLPTALAVDSCGRIFIADQSGQGILVNLSDMRLPGARVRNNALPGDRITDLWVDQNFLYVAAGAQGIKIFLIEPSCSAF